MSEALTFLLIAALIWQLMRAYTLSILTQLANTGSPIIEKEIVHWVNTKLEEHNKQSTLRSFQVIISKNYGINNSFCQKKRYAKVL